MAYDYLSPPTLPLPEDAVSGSDETTRLMLALARGCNRAHATVVARPIGEAWPDGQAVHSSTILTVATWRVPLMSDAHTVLLFDVDGQNAGANGGTVRFTSTAGSVDFVFNGLVGTSTRLTGTLAMPTGAVWADVSMVMFRAGVGDSVQINRVSAEYALLTSPLAAGRVATPSGIDFDPVGTAALAANTALGAFEGRTILDDLDAAIQRARSVTTWSGISLAGASAGQYHAPHMHRAPVLVRGGGLLAGVTYTVWVRAQRAGSDTYARFSAAPARSWPRGPAADDHTLEITIPAGATVDWYSGTLTLPEEMGLDGLEFPGCDVGLTLEAARGPAHTTAEVHGVSIWGE